MLFLPYQVDLEELDLHVYKYICANYDKVVYMRIRDLAAATNVSTSTILRFCRKFECEGYSEFKFKLKQYVNNPKLEQTTLQQFDQGANIDFLNKLITPYYQSQINKAAQIIIDSDLLVFIGIGASGIVANYGSHIFSTLVSLSIPISDPQNTPIYQISNNIHDNLCFVVFSVTGEQERIIDFIENNKLTNKKVISITNGSNSTLSHLADVNLSYYTSVEMFGDMNITSQIPAISIIETLSRVAYSLKMENVT